VAVKVRRASFQNLKNKYFFIQNIQNLKYFFSNKQAAIFFLKNMVFHIKCFRTHKIPLNQRNCKFQNI
jgi:hypothetical protein